MINLKTIGRIFFAIPILLFGIQYLAYGRFVRGVAAGAAMGSWRSSSSVFDGSAACGGRRLYLGERSRSVVSRCIRYVLFRVRGCLARDQTNHGYPSGQRTDRRLGSFGFGRRGLGASGKLACWRVTDGKDSRRYSARLGFICLRFPC
jgi:hypothetical protein